IDETGNQTPLAPPTGASLLPSTSPVGGGGNIAPLALDDSASTDPGQAVTIDVLANDSDSDGALDPNTVTVVSAPTNGTFNVNADGSITYTPNTGFQGSETFTYTVADNLGASSAEADVTVSVGASPAGMLDTTAQSGIDIDNVTLTGAFTVETWIWFRPGESISNKDGLLRAESGNAHINFFNGQLRFASYAPGEPRGDVVVGATQLGTGSWHHVAVT
ncbi:MAG: Ig-like domain-containing protein, partial [Pseudomonadota bacterium]